MQTTERLQSLERVQAHLVAATEGPSSEFSAHIADALEAARAASEAKLVPLRGDESPARIILVTSTLEMAATTDVVVAFGAALECMRRRILYVDAGPHADLSRRLLASVPAARSDLSGCTQVSERAYLVRVRTTDGLGDVLRGAGGFVVLVDGPRQTLNADRRVVCIDVDATVTDALKGGQRADLFVLRAPRDATMKRRWVRARESAGVPATINELWMDSASDSLADVEHLMRTDFAS